MYVHICICRMFVCVCARARGCAQTYPHTYEFETLDKVTWCAVIRAGDGVWYLRHVPRTSSTRRDPSESLRK